MKSTGIIRKVDELGRIVLPIELRRTLDIAERDELEIFMENDRIVLQKFEPACLFCGSSRGLVTYRTKIQGGAKTKVALGLFAAPCVTVELDGKRVSNISLAPYTADLGNSGTVLQRNLPQRIQEDRSL